MASVLKHLARAARFARRDQSGVAAVEFALLATLLLTLMAGGVDLTNALIVQRDVGRLSNEIAQTLATCTDQGCVQNTGLSINARVKNVAPGLDNVAIGFCSLRRIVDTISVETGNMTYLPADMIQEAKTIMADGDYGVAALITYTHTPFIIGFAKNWGFNVANFRSYTIALRRKP